MGESEKETWGRGSGEGPEVITVASGSNPNLFREPADLVARCLLILLNIEEQLVWKRAWAVVPGDH